MVQSARIYNSQQPLSELDFSDLYVRLDADSMPHYRGGHGGTMMLPDTDIPQAFYNDTADLANFLRENFDGVEAAVTYDNTRMRVTRLETAKGEVWAALRRLPLLPPALEKLGLAPHIPSAFQDLGRRSGLILVVGASGQGKTTTMSSMLMRFLETYGGIAFTIEDPVEYDMEGRRGENGYCYQSEVREEAEWGMMLKRALRWHPRYIAVGEIRTPDCANQVLRAATSGHTVLATMHAGSMEEGLEGLLQLAEQDTGDRAPLLLAAGLTSVIYQTFTLKGLFTQFMMTEADNSGSPVRAMIRDRRIGQTRTLADQQMAKLLQTGRIF
jgi:twitching motility protein PilT